MKLVGFLTFLLLLGLGLFVAMYPATETMASPGAAVTAADPFANLPQDG